MRPLTWQSQPHARLFQIFDRRRRSRGVWAVESIARAEFAKHPHGVLLVLDEYRATLPALGHCKRVVVAEEHTEAI